MEDIYSLIDQIYAAAAAAPEAWNSVLRNFIELFRGGHAILHAGAPSDASGAFAAHAGIADSDIARLQTPDAIRIAEPFMGRMPVDRVITRSEFISDADWERSAFYNELTRPIDGYYSVGARQELPDLSFSLAVCRGRRGGAFDAFESGVLQRLVPHMTTALQLGQRLRMSESRVAGFAQALDRLTAGVILADGNGLPAFVNARASEIMAEADGLTLNDLGLSAATPAATQRLRDAIATTAADGDVAAGASHLRVERPSHRPPLLLTLLPVWRTGIAVRGIRAPRVAVFIKEARPSTDIDPVAVAETFSLTRRESEVATLLAKGIGLAEIATRLELGRGTVRNHLKRVFDKTGTRSQAALVALVRGLSDTWK